MEPGSYAPATVRRRIADDDRRIGRRAAECVAPCTRQLHDRSAPLALQVDRAVALGLAGLALQGTMVGLALGAMARRLARAGRLPEREALHLGVAAGFFGAASSQGVAALRLRPNGRGCRTLTAPAPCSRCSRRLSAGCPGCSSQPSSSSRRCSSWTGHAVVDAENSGRKRPPRRPRDSRISGAPEGVQALGWILRRRLTAGRPARRLHRLVPP